jgi:hypothetical protein
MFLQIGTTPLFYTTQGIKLDMTTTILVVTSILLARWPPISNHIGQINLIRQSAKRVCCHWCPDYFILSFYSFLLLIVYINWIKYLVSLWHFHTLIIFTPHYPLYSPLPLASSSLQIIKEKAFLGCKQNERKYLIGCCCIIALFGLSC